jgi:hypothetical protein
MERRILIEDAVMRWIRVAGQSCVFGRRISMPTKANVKISDVKHIHICGGKNLYCAHPRHGGLWNFGNGELALIHPHASWPYKEKLPHGFGKGYKSSCVWLLQRSTDGGESWPEENNVVVYDETLPVEKRVEILFPRNPERERINLSAPESIVCFGRTLLGDLRPLDTNVARPKQGRASTTCFALRSADRGRTWDDKATVIRDPSEEFDCEITGYSTIKMPDGSLIMTASLSPHGIAAIYGTDDHGLTWSYLAQAGHTAASYGAISYPGLIRLPNGRIQCYMLDINGGTNSILMSESDDVYNWTEPRSIVRYGASPWHARLRHGQHFPLSSSFPGPKLYRSPWPVLLSDGRIVVIFTRRRAPAGIGGILSEDGGKTWSNEFVIRDDASGTDIGYAVAVEVEDGRVFAAYYYMVEGNTKETPRFIAGSFFSI